MHITVDTFPPNDLYFGLQQSLTPDQSYAFGSEAVNLEYSSLSAILGLNNYSPDQPFLTSETPPASAPATFGTQFANSGWPAEPSQQQQQQESQPNISPQSLMGEQSAAYDGGYPSASSASGSYAQPAGQYGGPIYEGAASNINVGQNGRSIAAQQQAVAVQRLPSDSTYSASELGYPNQQTYAQAVALQQQRMNSTQTISGRSSIGPSGSFATGTPPSTDSPMPSTPLNEAPPSMPMPMRTSGAEFYASIIKPYSYVESYAFLMKYLHNKCACSLCHMVLLEMLTP